MDASTTLAVDPQTANVIVDHVLRYAPTGINVKIIGAGVGGLLSALECWRKGHDVEVLERAPALSHIGDTITPGPSGIVVFKHYPTMLEEYTKLSVKAKLYAYSLEGQAVGRPQEFEWNQQDVAEHVAHPIHVPMAISRSDLVEILYDQCQRLGIPVRWGVSIKDYEEDSHLQAGIAVSGDERFSADVVVAADGLGSKSHKLILGENVRAVPTGYTIYRAALWTRDLKNAPLLQEAVRDGQAAVTRFYLGHNIHIVFVISTRFIALNITLPDVDQGPIVESWSSTITREEMMARIPNIESLDPYIVEAIRCFPQNSIVAWRLCMRDPQRTWTSQAGHVVQVGDSAHSYVPTSGSGGTMAMEDAITLAECLRLAGRDHVGIATKTYQLLRQPRTQLTQLMGLRNRAVWHTASALQAMELRKLTVFGKWVWIHDAEKYAKLNFHKARAHLETGAEFQNTNLPPGYRYEPWTIQKEVEREKNGVKSDLTSNGDWSLV
ncbi:hypothetical protein BKA67DRAFT_691983 [Truncatella angustata]|uniref:FAD-binding domain-containing protein n=1 Tax=Truncatella angustata TaxID=152316 RepID=A0A9P8UIH1_9PEZI|nr:uncharacterized protein BKA67DRAFT_691983 [Truncatella angustata]KAH6652633.1 hypothetical protein BKA67DRAFT_691983 [Truncatella angustata]